MFYFIPQVYYMAGLLISKKKKRKVVKGYLDFE